MLSKGIVYYTDNSLKESFAELIRKRLVLSAGNLAIVWVSQKPIYQQPNILMKGLGRSHHSMCLEILTGIQSLWTDIVFFAEHDVIYHPSHFEFTPPRQDVFYYNRNRYWLNSKTGQASTHKSCFGALSQLCAYRKLAESHYIERVDAYSRGINVRRYHGTEPGKHKGDIITNHEIGEFCSPCPNIDIRHGRNFTKSDRFRKGYTLVDEIPCWGRTKGRYEDFLKSINNKWL